MLKAGLVPVSLLSDVGSLINGGFEQVSGHYISLAFSKRPAE